MLCAAFVINEMMVRRPWAHVNVLFSRNIGLSLVVILLYNPHQPVQFIAGAELPFRRRPVAAGTDRRAAGAVGRAADVRVCAGVDLPAPASRPPGGAGHRPVGFRRGEFIGDAVDARLGARRFRRDRAPAVDRPGLHPAADHPDRAGQLRFHPGDCVRGLHPGDAARRRRDRRGADGHLAARP